MPGLDEAEAFLTPVAARTVALVAGLVATSLAWRYIEGVKRLDQKRNHALWLVGQQMKLEAFDISVPSDDFPDPAQRPSRLSNASWIASSVSSPSGSGMDRNAVSASATSRPYAAPTTPAFAYGSAATPRSQTPVGRPRAASVRQIRAAPFTWSRKSRQLIGLRKAVARGASRSRRSTTPGRWRGAAIRRRCTSLGDATRCTGSTR
jgi:hypothetical protein